MSQRNALRSRRNIISGWLVRQAARLGPAHLVERLEEEWHADLRQRDSALARMNFALGCCWALMVISLDCLQHAPATHPWMALGDSPMSARSLRYVTLRPATLFLILGLHAALFWGLTTLLPHTT